MYQHLPIVFPSLKYFICMQCFNIGQLIMWHLIFVGNFTPHPVSLIIMYLKHITPSHSS